MKCSTSPQESHARRILERQLEKSAHFSTEIAKSLKATRKRYETSLNEKSRLQSKVSSLISLNLGRKVPELNEKVHELDLHEKLAEIVAQNQSCSTTWSSEIDSLKLAQSERLSSIEERNCHLFKSLTCALDKLKEADNQIKDLEQSTKEKDEEIEQQVNRVSNLATELEALKMHQVKHEEVETGMKRDIEKLDEEKAALITQVNQLTSELKLLKSSFCSIEQRLETRVNRESCLMEELKKEMEKRNKLAKAFRLMRICMIDSRRSVPFHCDLDQVLGEDDDDDAENIIKVSNARISHRGKVDHVKHLIRDAPFL